MSFSIHPDLIGQVGITPRTVKVLSNDTLAQVTAPNYMNSKNLYPYSLKQTDKIEMIYGYNKATGVGTYGEFYPSLNTATGVVTLIPLINGASVLLPVTNGDLPVFNGTTGQIKDSGIKTVANQSGGTVMTLTSNGVINNGGLLANNQNAIVFYKGIITPDLINAGNITLLNSSGSSQFMPILIQMGKNASGTGSNWVGGNKTINITDLTTTFSVIASASILDVENWTWGNASGGLGFPNTPAGVGSVTAPGAPLIMQYGTGSTSYTAGTGSFQFVVVAIQVA